MLHSFYANPLAVVHPWKRLAPACQPEPVAGDIINQNQNTFLSTCDIKQCLLVKYQPGIEGAIAGKADVFIIKTEKLVISWLSICYARYYNCFFDGRWWLNLLNHKSTLQV